MLCLQQPPVSFAGAGWGNQGMLVSNYCHWAPPKVQLKRSVTQSARVSCTDCKSWCFKPSHLLGWSTGISVFQLVQLFSPLEFGNLWASLL